VTTRTNVALNVVAADTDEAQSVANALAAVVSTLVRNGATDVSLRVSTWDDGEEETGEDTEGE
jgi:hypothetical protein